MQNKPVYYIVSLLFKLCPKSSKQRSVIMKSAFSSRASKFHVLMTLGALGFTAFSLPMTAVAQETCVRTSSGSVVCGTPVAKPGSRQEPSNNNVTIDTQIQGTVTWELKSCARGVRNVVSCTLSLSTSQDLGYVVVLNNETKLVDSSGNEYRANRVQIGDRTAGSGNQLNFNMAKGARYRTTINFTDVPTSISQVALLQVVTYAYEQVKFRNVPIN